MGDDQYGAVDLFVHFLEDVDQIAERPQVDAGLGLVEDGELRASGDNHGDFNALELAAGQAGVDLAGDIVLGAQAHLAQVGAHLGYGQLASGRQRDQVAHGQALEANRLLKGEADAPAGALGDGERGNVLAVEQNLALGGAQDAGNHLGQRGFAAAVGAGDRDEALVDGQVDMLQDLLVGLCVVRGEGNIAKLEHR